MQRRSARAGLSEISDFNLVCLVLDGSQDAAKELCNRAVVPSSLALGAIRPFLHAGQTSTHVPMDGAFGVLASCVDDNSRGLRSMPDGAAFPSWFRLWAFHRLRPAPIPNSKSPCLTPAAILRHARRLLPNRARGGADDHLALCSSCRETLAFALGETTQSPGAVNLSGESFREGRRRVMDLLGERAPIVGFGVNHEIARVLYTSGERGTDVFASESRVLYCEGVNIRLGELAVQIKCLPESPSDAERYSVGAVFSATTERLPVYLEVEQEGQRQVTLRDGAAEFRYLRGGAHALRFGRFKGQSILLDVKPYASQLGDLLLIADGLTKKAEEASGTPLEIALYYRLCDVTLRAWASHKGDARPLLRLLRTYFGRPIGVIDPARLQDISRGSASDRATFVHLHRSSPVRALAFVGSLAPVCKEALRPLCAVYVARQARDDTRLHETLTSLRAHALPDDVETDRYVRSLCDWLASKGRDTTIREDLMARLAGKYVAGLIARFDAAP